MCCNSIYTWHTTKNKIVGEMRNERLIFYLLGSMCIKHEVTCKKWSNHYIDVIMSAMASQITGVAIAYSTVCSGADQRKYQSSAWLAFVREIMYHQRIASWMNDRASLSTVSHACTMMTLSNKNIFRDTGPLCGEFTVTDVFSPVICITNTNTFSIYDLNGYRLFD